MDKSSAQQTRILSPEQTIIFITLIFGIPFFCLLFSCYMRFFDPQRTLKLKTIATRVSDALLIVLNILPLVVLGLVVWLSLGAIDVRNDPRNVELLTAFWIHGFEADYINQILWIWCLWSVKGTFMCLYDDIRALGNLPKLTNTIIKTTSISLFLTFLISILVNVLWCQPMSSNWKAEPEHCSIQTDIAPLAIVGALHLVTDILVLYIPILIIRHIPVQRTDRSAFAFIFLLGTLTVGAGTASFALRLDAQKNYGTVHLQDDVSHVLEVQRRIEKVRLSSLVEAAIGMLTVCLPYLRLALRRGGVKGDSAAARTPTPSVNVGMRGWDQMEEVSVFDDKRTYFEMMPTSAVIPVTTLKSVSSEDGIRGAGYAV